ncbi:hypothetical protein HK107_04890 [Parvularcula sp. ZS-1/3]|uniref:Lipoprotein n=1 Tax=Parvularcula mediterranea TaxID=2732508 RepID=A0A7Y3W4V9_9PROT|nr:hypothetical protein [Parvularcula mediterranea]NNU15652.1 hypothetical protein [Parvularcula mediterranea]
MFRRLFALAAMGALGACASVSTDTVFTGEEDNILVVIRGAKQSAYIDGWGFQKVNVDTLRFSSDSFDVNVAVAFSQKMAIPEGIDTGRANYYITTNEGPGAFAFTRRTGSSPTVPVLNCYADGAAVFQLRRGVVNVIDIDDPRGRKTAERIEEEVKPALAQYEGITAEVVAAPVTHFVRFEMGSSGDVYSRCPDSDEVLSVVPAAEWFRDNPERSGITVIRG